jgi:hypothetical protein
MTSGARKALGKQILGTPSSKTPYFHTISAPACELLTFLQRRHNEVDFLPEPVLLGELLEELLQTLGTLLHIPRLPIGGFYHHVTMYLTGTPK